MRKERYTKRQRWLIVRAVQKAKQGFIPFVSFLSSLSEEEQEYLKEKFGIDEDDQEWLLYARAAIWNTDEYRFIQPV